MSANQKHIARRQPQSQLDGDGLHPLLQRIYENRNVQSLDELDYSLHNLHPPAMLKGIDDAVKLLMKAIDDQAKILIVGDYDADGATATTVAMLGLRALGAGEVGYLTPNRFEYGYGLSAEIAEIALQKKPALVVTVDNGIASIEGVARLRAAGVAVIVTDHHLAGEELPEADAIVNPNQPGCTFPSKALAGVGVMFYVLLALRSAMRDAGRFNARETVPNLAELLDLVALGTVADLVALDYNNRILVAQGGARVRAGKCRPGIKALLHVTRRNCAGFNTTDFGFLLGPRLNAAGRMDDIGTGIECLLADDDTAALKLALELDQINRERREVESEMQKQAAKIVRNFRNHGHARAGDGDGDADGDDTDAADRRGWCLFDPDWHPGVIGLVANRVREYSGQPAVVFARANADGDGQLRGSARSVRGLHIRDLLANLTAVRPGVIDRFGGHAMAAGLTINEDNFAAFADGFGELVAAHFAHNPPDNTIMTDGVLTGDDLNLETAEMVGAASPWGQQFPAPLFDGEFHVTRRRIVGMQHLQMTLAPVSDDGWMESGEVDAIAFRYVAPGEGAPDLDLVTAAYQLKVNDYQGKRSLQLLVEYLQPSAREHPR